MTTYRDLKAEDVSLAERMAYIDFKLQFTGMINRSDLKNMFGLAEAASSKMMKMYTDRFSGNMGYNRKKRANTIKSDTFKPFLDLSADTALGMLANGFNKNKILTEPMLPYARIGIPNSHLDVNNVACITRAIAGGYSVTANYFSANSKGESWREIFPLAIFFNGKTWSFRGCCKKDSPEGVFKNFDFARVKEVKANEDNRISNEESLSNDRMWSTQVPLLLIPHPSLPEDDQNIIKMDFGFMHDTKLIVYERAALVYVMTKLWQIDARTDDEVDKGPPSDPLQYQFKLTNQDMVDVVIKDLESRSQD